MIGWQFKKFDPEASGGSPFDKLLKLFQEILMHTSGDVPEAISWLTELDRQYKLTTPDYGIADFLKELEERGFLQRPPGDEGFDGSRPTRKMEIALRQKSLDDVFGDLKKAKSGQHRTPAIGRGDEVTADLKPFEFGDSLENIAISNSLRNAQIHHGIDDFQLSQEDLEVNETFFQSQTSTVLMIDVSHSMILYGEDRITPAKKVAMALAEFITTRYPKDTLDVLAFGDDAWPIEVKDLPYLQVGPFHTNTVAGLQLAMDLLKRRRNPNKQIFMITDGKPTCIKKGKKYYKNSWGLDAQIINRCLNLAVQCRRLTIPVTTFMIARDPMLVDFVDQFTAANGGKAFHSNLEGLGSFVFEGYKKGKAGRRK